MKNLSILIPLLLLVAIVAGCGGATPAPTAAPAPATAPAATSAAAPTTASTGSCSIKLATTTSTADSGLLPFILPDFEKKFNCKVDVIAVGTGQAIQIGQKGDADVLLVHARSQEDAFVKAGDARQRFDVMYNDFIILGPKNDPAKVAASGNAIDAFKAIANTQSPFASRGDKSGTNTKELAIWASAGITPTKEMAWYNALGQGMGDTLLFTNEKQAYTLSDRATYLAMKAKLPNLVVALGGNSLQENKDKTLLNPYGVMAVNPDKHPGVNFAMAMNFVNWIISPDTQKLIASYGVDKFGQQLFYPNAKP